MVSDYERIEQAITYLVEQAGSQPTLEQVSAHVNLSPYHFQRLFTRWAGTSPKRFLQVLTLEHSKALLAESRSLLDTALDIGLSGGSRLHDHFVQLEAVTPGEFKTKGEGVRISYGVHESPFGDLLVARTDRGVCRAAFLDYSDLSDELAQLRTRWPASTLVEDPETTAPVVARMLGRPEGQAEGPISIRVSGTNFQIAVWRALMNIPYGAVVSYADIARSLGQPRASRAVGGAIGANPVALLIPCHRVIQQSGALGGYRWGPNRKRVIQAWERLRTEPETAVS